MRGLLIASVLVAAGCSVDAVDLEGKECPCATGYRCDLATYTCVRGPPPFDGGSIDDAAVDALPVDAPGVDAPALDAAGRDTGTLDALVPDAPGLDAGPLDSGLDDTACDDVFTGALFCDSFEMPGFLRWNEVREMSGDVTHATDRAYRGAASLRAESLAPSGQADVIGYSSTPLTSGTATLRAYVYVPSGPAFTDVAILASHENSAPLQGIAFGVRDGERPYVYSSTAGVSIPAPTVRMPRDRWVCVVLTLTIHDTAGSFELRVDDEIAVSRTGVDTRPAGGYATLVAGVSYTSPAQAPIALYIDELAIDDSPIGCD